MVLWHWVAAFGNRWNPISPNAIKFATVQNDGRHL